MNPKLTPQNKMAQLLHRATGNPANTLPDSAVSNCWPGLEYDFKNFWRRVFVGIVLQEWDNYVIGIEDPQYEGLLHHRLLVVDGLAVVTTMSGPQIPGGSPVQLPSATNPAAMTMEWSNALAFIHDRHGRKVTCHFTKDVSPIAQPASQDPSKTLSIDLAVRPIFEPGTASPSRDLVKPGELTQCLCSPWQHDYRECSCYYWPASRPDYVNVEPGPTGVSRGDNWLAKQRTGDYILDDRVDSRLVSYDDLFLNWEAQLKFQIRGRDKEET